MGGKKRRIDDDPRVRVTKDISTKDFILVNDQSYQYREKVLPDAFTLEFWENSSLLRFLTDQRFLQSEILDVGCGSGEIDIMIARNGYTVTAVDISPYAITKAKKLAQKYSDCNGRLTFLAGDIEDMVFGRKFSSAIISHTLEHLINPEKTMEKIVDLLAPGSNILVAVPNRKAWNDRTHLRHYSKRTLRTFLSSYGTDLEVWVDKPERMIFAVLRSRDK